MSAYSVSTCHVWGVGGYLSAYSVCTYHVETGEVHVRCLLYILDMFFVSLRQGLLMNSEFTGLARLVSQGGPGISYSTPTS